jgi:hypothetical protein
MNILHFTNENPAEYVLRPRFDQLGGDSSRYFHCPGSQWTDEKGETHTGGITFADVAMLDDALARSEAKLLITDPGIRWVAGLVGRKQRIELGASYHALANGGFSRRGVSDSSCRCVQRGKLDSKRFRVNYLPVRVKISPMSRNAATSLPGYTARERSKLLCSSMI